MIVWDIINCTNSKYYAMTITKQILLVEDIKKKKKWTSIPNMVEKKSCDTHGVIFFVSTIYES